MCACVLVDVKHIATCACVYICVCVSVCVCVLCVLINSCGEVASYNSLGFDVLSTKNVAVLMCH